MKSLQELMTFRPWQRHGLVLMVGGFVYICFGIALATYGDLSERRTIQLVIALRMFSLGTWGVIFIVAGFLACMSSRWPTFSNSWGYSVLTALASAWSGVYIFGYFIGDAPISNVNYGLIWGLLAFMWWGISGLVNPEHIRRLTNGPD